MALVLFLLIAGGAIAVFVWDFRRKAAAREAISKQRFEEIFKTRPAATPVPPADAPPAAVPAAAPPEGKVPAVAAVSAIAAPPARERFLGQRETLLYRLLKVGIPDHEVFANVALASVVGSRNEQETRRLAQYRLAFVVCDKNMRVVAVVEFEAAGGMQGVGEQRFVADCLKAAGVSFVRLNPAILPRRDEIRALVCGPSSPAVS